MPVRPRMLLALLVAVPAHAKPAKAPETVTLTFGWQPGWEAEVSHTKEVADRPTSPAVRYALTVAAGKDGELLLRSTMLGEPPLPPGLPPETVDVLRRVAAVPVTERIGPDGAYRGRDDPTVADALAEDLRGAAAPAVATQPDPASQEPLRGVVASMLSGWAIEAVGQGDWGEAVGVWVGATMEVGRAYPYDEPLPTRFGAALPAHGTYAAEGFEPCHDGRKAPTCVRLHLHQEVDPSALAAWMQGLLGVPVPEGWAVETTGLTIDLVTLAEPSTTRPWRVRRTTVAEGRFVHDGETRSFDVHQTENRVWRWR